MATRPKNPLLASLIQTRAFREGRKRQVDLMRSTGYGRGPIGALWRGDVARVDPEVANRVCSELGIPMRTFLRAAGYNISDATTNVPEDLEELVLLWPRLSQQVKLGLLTLARAATKPNQGPGSLAD
jgi:hypothetical protein